MRRAPRRPERPSRPEPPGAAAAAAAAAAGPVSVEDTLNSGQVFLWERDERTGAWFGIDGQRAVRMSGGTPSVRASAPGRGPLLRPRGEARRALECVCRDAEARRAVRALPGLRLLRQDPFQCYVSFIASTNSSIRCIRRRLGLLCRAFGERVEFEGREFAVFPTPGRLAAAGRGELAACALGYRAEFVRGAAAAAADGRIDLGRLGRAGYGEAREALIGIPGIGHKVADCIMLFSLDKTEAFPLDRWMLRALERRYPGRYAAGGTLTPRRYEALHDEAVAHFGPYAGYAQQFLFKAERDAGAGEWLREPLPAAGPAFADA